VAGAPADDESSTPAPSELVQSIDERDGPLVALSTASVYPESTANGFALGSRLGYDAVEVMVGIDPVSQDVKAVKHLSEYHEIPVCAVHAPCLLITQRVWGTEPWGKLERSAEMAHEVGADVVVVHPPFRWQREYARNFVEGIAGLEERTGIAFAVENMYPWRAPRREVQAYAPGWNPVDHDFANVTLDLSHSATAQTDPVVSPKPVQGTATAGPDWIAIGSEGGFLPAPTVVDGQQPTTWITDPTGRMSGSAAAIPVRTFTPEAVLVPLQYAVAVNRSRAPGTGVASVARTSACRAA